MRKITPILISVILLCIYGCSKEIKQNYSVIKVSLSNNDLDSIIIYDKEKSWEVKSLLDLTNSETIIDTLDILDKKIYQIYSFKEGAQSEFGEIIISPESEINLIFNKSTTTNPVTFSGSYKNANNFLAYSKNSQNELTNLVRNGIDSIDLKNQISDKLDLIKQKSNKLNITDSLKTYAFDKFNHFSEVLLKKNEKYLYKSSLVNKIGNNFTFKDINNKSVSLKEFKGKYVYIDVWATWCKPCKVEHKFLEELEKAFTNNKELQIISISTDRDYQKWKNHVLEKSIKGIQIHSGHDSEFVKFYDIGSLPRFIFLDKNGKIINPDEIRPSNKNLKYKIEEII